MAIIKPVDETKIFIQPLPDFVSEQQDIQVSMLRLDTVHPFISGNKWYKLKYNISAALDAQKNSLLSFGGAYSNHLIATAAAAHSAGMGAIGFVRGLQDEQNLNPVLTQCKEYGMALYFISREAYATKEDADFLNRLQLQFPEAWIIPEGGANPAGRKGAGEISTFVSSDFTHVILSTGSGTTFTGLRNALPAAQSLLGFAPMKGGIYLQHQIIQFLDPGKNTNWSLTDRFHFGGFGKMNDSLQDFMSSFRQQYNFSLDRVYTAKMMAGLQQLLRENAFPARANILCLHTGGLTGN